jgi:hypothetical protein
VLRTGQRFSLNLLSSVSAQGQLRFMVVKGRVAGAQVCEFIRRLMYRAKRPVWLILDGHPMHKSKLVSSASKVMAANSSSISCRPTARNSPRMNKSGTT